MYESLTVLIPDLEKGEYGKWTEQKGDGTPENPYTFCYIEYSDPMNDLIRTVREFEKNHHEEDYNLPDIMDEIHRRCPDSKDLYEIDLSRLDGFLIVGMILFVISMCRFDDSAFLNFCESGAVLRCLKRLKEIDEAEDKTV